MDVREEIQKRIDKKEEEIRELELKIRESRAYIQALSDTLRFLPKEAATLTNPDLALRPGTMMAKAREIIKNAGKPLHVTEILEALGKPVDRDNRSSISGSIAAYVRRGEIFKKVAPNTFGLIEVAYTSAHSTAVAKVMDKEEIDEELNSNEDDPPEFFGMDENEGELDGKVEIKDEDIPF